jgi:hypothetical protein
MSFKCKKSGILKEKLHFSSKVFTLFISNLHYGSIGKHQPFNKAFYNATHSSGNSQKSINMTGQIASTLTISFVFTRSKK